MITPKQAKELKALILADGVATYEHGWMMYPAWNDDNGTPKAKQAEVLARCRAKAAEKADERYIDRITLKLEVAK